MEPAYETLDPLIKEMAEPLKELMAAFSEVSRSNDYAANQYQKARSFTLSSIRLPMNLSLWDMNSYTQ